MLLIDHFIDRSPIHGLGVFAAEAVPQGTVVWRFDPVVDTILREDDLKGLPEHQVRMILHRSEWYPERDHFVPSSDGDAFMNHSGTPNLLNLIDTAVARVDIAIGDELTCDYRSCRVLAFDPELLGAA